MNSVVSVKGDIIPLMLQHRQRKRSRCEGSGAAAQQQQLATKMTKSVVVPFDV